MRFFLLFVVLFIISCSTVNKKPYYGLNSDIEHILNEYTIRYNCGKHTSSHCKIDDLKFSVTANTVIKLGTKKVILLSHSNILQYTDTKNRDIKFWRSYPITQKDIENNKTISSFLLKVMKYL